MNAAVFLLLDSVVRHARSNRYRDAGPNYISSQQVFEYEVAFCMASNKHRAEDEPPGISAYEQWRRIKQQEQA